MTTTIETVDGITVIAIEGRLDTVTAADFDKAIQPLMEQKNLKIIINCSDMTYISSSGLREFMLLQKCTMKNGGTLSIEGMIPTIREVFDMTGFSSIFHIKE